MRVSAVYCLVLIALFAAMRGSAQPGTVVSAPAPLGGLATAELHGVVTSTDGTVYEGASVVLQLNGNALRTFTTQTSSTGTFGFSGVAPGAFKLTVSAQGFQTQTITGVLHASQDFDAGTIALPVAGAINQITVSAELQQVQLAQEQLNLEEKQRVLGVFPNYYVSYDRDPEPLTPRQKFQLAWKISIDPVTLALTGVIAGAEQATDTLPAYGQGMEGYGKRFGAGYAYTFTDTMIGGAILPSIFRQDPRYIYKGTGSAPSLAWYAISNSVICRGDNRHWQFNYSGILGGFAAGAIANLYDPPSSHSAFNVTVSNGLIGIGEGALQNLAQEFIVRKLTPKLQKTPR